MDSFKKPFRAVEIQLAAHHRLKQRRERRRRSIVTTVLVALGVFVIGMAVTNFTTVSRYLPTSLFNAGTSNRPTLVYFPNCSAARATGQAPLRAGSPGYRIGLDADGDGVACEPYVEP